MNTATTARIWSDQQKVGFSFITDEPGSAVMIAVAGAGKTTTLVEMCQLAVKKLINGRKPTIRFAAFNKAIQVELQQRIPSEVAEVKTAHAFGFALYSRVHAGRKLVVDAGEKWKRIEEKLQTPRVFSGFVRKIVHLAKCRAIGILTRGIDNRADWMAIVSKWDLDLELAKATSDDNYAHLSPDAILDLAIDYAINSLSDSIELAEKEALIDFDDMVYMPLISECKVFQVDYLFVDEAQDTNPMLRCLYRKLLRPGGRLIAVGDPCQAIYGFTGADNDALSIIKHEFNCKEIPLTITYRCPKLVVREAQAAGVTHIQAAETAPMGDVARLAEYEDLAKEELNIKKAVLCRKTAPLISTAFDLIAQGIPCHVEGRDIGEGLISLIGKWKRVKTLFTLKEKLAEWADKQINKLMSTGRETAADAINDKVESLNVLIDACPPGATVDDLRARIKAMFADGTSTVTLATVHRSKGREWDTVYILGRSEFMPSKYARQDWQVQQEMNLIYVAITRSMNRLVYVPAPPENTRKKAK